MTRTIIVEIYQTRIYISELQSTLLHTFLISNPAWQDFPVPLLPQILQVSGIAVDLPVVRISHLLFLYFLFHLPFISHADLAHNLLPFSVP